MLRIGIIGSDNSHALAFSKLANLPNAQGEYAFENVRVAGIFGLDAKRTAQVAQEGNIPFIAQSPEELKGRVDAVMVVFRQGGLHYAYALPFIKAGIPTWVDKPFTMDYTQALSLVEAAKKHNTLLAGGSTCKYCYDVLMLKNSFEQLKASGKIFSGTFNFPGDINSEYGGIYFYGGHAAEILTTVFGTDVQSIKTDIHNGNLIALVKYPDFTVTIDFSNVSQFYGTIYAEAGVVSRPIDISIIYRLGFAKFVEALEKGKMIESFESLLLPVRILNTLQASIQNGGQEAFLKDFPR